MSLEPLENARAARGPCAAIEELTSPQERRAASPASLRSHLLTQARLGKVHCTRVDESADPCRPLVLLLLLLDPQVRRAPGRLATLQAQAGHSLEPDFLICVRVALTRRLSRAVLPPTSSCRLESGRPPPPSSPSRETASTALRALSALRVAKSAVPRRSRKYALRG